jgi:uncharacterized repeat protein (TIGR01451 family)
MKRFRLLLLCIFLIGGLKLSAQITVTCTTLQQPCNGNGVLAVQVSAGVTLPLTYYYYNASGSLLATHNVSSIHDTLTGISSAVGFVYIMDASGNYFSSSGTGMVPPFTIDPPSITNAVCPSLTGTISLTINGGTTPVSVQWYDDSYSGSGAYVGTGNPVSLPPGEYAAYVTDAAGCIVFTGTDSLSNFYIQNISGINFSVVTTDATTCTNGTATVTGITGGMAPYTYLWNNAATSSTITGLPQGYYTATVTDAQGCHSSNGNWVSQSVYINANPVASDATCLQNDGSVISFGSGGTPPYSYFYSNGFSGQTASGLAGNTYMWVTATDANGCTGTDYFYIATSTPITVTYSIVSSSCTAPTGSATLSISGGIPPYTVNWGTSPALTGTSISGMPAGSYSFSVTDAAGCTQSGTVVISPVSVISGSINYTNPPCPATTGSLAAVISGTSPPFSYLWNTGATSSSLTSVPLGSYSCIITDNAGCTATKYAYLMNTPPMSIGISTTPSSCLYATDGSAYANVTGGTAPYTYYWSNGQTTQTATGLGTGSYYVTVTDANGCSSYTHYTYVGYDPAGTSCYCTITGKVYKDVNSNCILDAGEQGIQNIMIHCSGFGYAFTDVNGDYTFQVPTGSYTLSESVQYTYPLASCQSNSIPVSVTAASGCSNTVNFANNVTTIHDIHITRTSVNYPIPGNNYTQALIVENDGTVNESSIQFGFSDDGQLNLLSTSPVSYTQLSPGTAPNWYSINSGFPSLAPGASLVLYNNYYVPTYVPISTTVNFKDTSSYSSPLASGWLNDYTPWNNVDQYHTTVIGSYDPNFKEVSPAGTGAQGYIATSDSVLDYVVHFQNTGTYYAEKVVVTDTLDSDLDISSFQPGYSDHNYTVTISESGIVTFTFDNIHLNYQSSSEMGSRGMVGYSIKQKPNLIPGTQIKNSAAIYFDYNTPVITNQTLNTIQTLAGVEEATSANDLLIYPNPADEILNINVSGTHAVSIAIYDLQGRVIRNEKVSSGTEVQKLDISQLVKGLYFVVAENAEGQKLTRKFIKN